MLVLRGEAGIGKTSLLRYIAGQASDCRIAQIAGVESELEMPFAALQQLCGPMMHDRVRLPPPQLQALQVAFGIVEGPVPDRFVVGLAVLGLLAEAAAQLPLVCLVDDAQWLDEPSRQVLGFVGRRLQAEAVLLLCAVREPTDPRMLASLPDLTIHGLADDDARALLAAASSGHLDNQVRDRLVAETRGNPLVLLELASGMSKAELLGGFAVPPTATLAGGLQEHYLRRVRALPEPTQRLMVLAAADPTGDATLVWRAAESMGLRRDAVAPAAAAGLLEIGSAVRFSHPLVRSAAYAAGSADDRRAVHLGLAAATDAEGDPDRRVWHLAAAASGPDEDIAAALELSAGRAQARAGLAAAAVFLQRSVVLTAEPGRRAERALAAAHAHLHAGAYDVASGLLAEAQADAVDDLQRARVEQLRAEIARAANSGSEAPVLLLQSAKRLESLQPQLAQDTYLDAWSAALVAGRLGEPGGHLLEVSQAARSFAPASNSLQAGAILLDGLATLITDGLAAAAPSLRAAVDAFLGGQPSVDQWLHWGVLASNAALALWDFDSWETVSARHVELARSSDALAPLAGALNVNRAVAVWRGDFDMAVSMGVEEDAVKEVTGTRRASYGAVLLAAYRGAVPAALSLFAATAADASARGEGLGLQMVDRATAILHNGLGHYPEALTAAERAADGNLGPFTALALPELIEAAIRTGRADRAGEAMSRLTDFTDIAGADWAAGLAARCRALLSAGHDADQHYTDAVERLSRTRLQPEIARTRLLYGEWLRRERRRTDARDQLHAAHDAFATMGADGFAERARRELLATGEKVRKRQVDTLHELTPQEENIARLARAGRTNPEIGAELFISARTVEWHLRKVFGKLAITSRKELEEALPARGRYRAPAS